MDSSALFCDFSSLNVVHLHLLVPLTMSWWKKLQEAGVELPNHPKLPDGLVARREPGPAAKLRGGTTTITVCVCVRYQGVSTED